MFEKNRNVIGVWVFTAYDDGEVDVTQTAPYRDNFAGVEAAIVKIARWCAKTIKHKAKCPFSPDNPEVVSDPIVDGSDKFTT